MNSSRFVYLPWLTVLILLLEIAELHCTLGDILIGTAALALALMFTRSPAFKGWRWEKVIALLVVLGVGYTMFSEWLNTTLLRWS